MVCFKKRGRVKKSQSAIEFIIVFAVVLIFFILFFGIIQNSQRDKKLEDKRRILQNIALDARDEINIAAGASDGYSREFDIPDNALGQEFQINITKLGDVYIQSEIYYASFRASNVTGDLKKGTNTIKKENGNVYLNS